MGRASAELLVAWQFLNPTYQILQDLLKKKGYLNRIFLETHTCIQRSKSFLRISEHNGTRMQDLVA